MSTPAWFGKLYHKEVFVSRYDDVTNIVSGRVWLTDWIVQLLWEYVKNVDKKMIMMLIGGGR